MKDLARVLAIETAGEACSVALFEGGAPLARDHRVLGRGHAEALVPMIAALPDRGRAQRICVSLGPGSFTGVRIGIATARALGFAWNAEVLGYPTLALVAAMALKETGEDGVTVCMNGGHGEWFVQNFDGTQPHDEIRSSPSETALAFAHHKLVAGNRARELVDLIGGEAEALAVIPDAGEVRLLPDTSLSDMLAPIYGRPPDARPQTGHSSAVRTAR